MALFQHSAFKRVICLKPNIHWVKSIFLEEPMYMLAGIINIAFVFRIQRSEMANRETNVK